MYLQHQDKDINFSKLLMGEEIVISFKPFFSKARSVCHNHWHM